MCDVGYRERAEAERYETPSPRIPRYQSRTRKNKERAACCDKESDELDSEVQRHSQRAVEHADNLRMLFLGEVG